MIEYRFEPENSRSAAYADGRLIGECDYQKRNGTWFITHTEVAEEYGHRGIARELVLMTDREAKRHGYVTAPVCSYAVKVLGESRTGA